MKITKSIKSKLYPYFKHRLGLKKSTKGFLRGNCPYCGGKFTFGVNIDKLKVNCFKDCGIPRSLLGLVMYLENFETYHELRAFLDIQEEYAAYDSVFKDTKPLKEYPPITLPEGYTPILSGSGLLANAARKYLRNRGFNLKRLSKSGVGYSLVGQYMGYLIFPFYSRGVLEFFQGRRFASSGPKMQNPKEEDYGIGKTFLIYNRDALFMYTRVYIVESITNALTLGDNAIALLGKTISNYQLSCIIQSPVQEIVIILDPDATMEAVTLALQLIYHKKVKLVYWPGNQDVNDLGKVKTLDLVKSTPYQKYIDFIKLKNQLRHAEGLNTYSGGIPPVVNIKSALR